MTSSSGARAARAAPTPDDALLRDARLLRRASCAPGPGTAFGPEPLLTQSAFFRYHNASDDVGGLYIVGAGTHPGAGLPGVLNAAKVLSRVPRVGPAAGRADAPASRPGARGAA
ncbi:MAG: hypothetical protein U1F43_17930 [Myxococcota bacterium]